MIFQAPSLVSLLLCSALVDSVVATSFGRSQEQQDDNEMNEIMMIALALAPGDDKTETKNAAISLSSTDDITIDDHLSQRNLQQCDSVAAYHPNYLLPWDQGKCELVVTCNSPSYATELKCCKAAYGGQSSMACIKSLANPPTNAPTKFGGSDVYYPDYSLPWPEGKCINAEPVPSGRPTYATQLGCCKAAYGGQMSKVCVKSLANPPTNAPTKFGGPDIYYPDYTLPWPEGKCINTEPVPSGLSTYPTMLACCQAAYGGQMSRACSTAATQASSIKPMTVSPTMAPTTVAPTTSSPYRVPMSAPSTASPSNIPTLSPTTLAPTSLPTTAYPSHAPTSPPSTASPSNSPTLSPTTLAPTSLPTTASPSHAPTSTPSTATPSNSPTLSPTTLAPTPLPTAFPSSVPTARPSTATPTNSPTKSCFPNKATLQDAVNTYIDGNCTQNRSSVQCETLNSWGWPMGAWCTSLITDMSWLFNGKSTFNEDIGAWNVGSVTKMIATFYDASTFNQNIGSWNVGLVTDMSDLFHGASAFNQNIGSWNVGSVRDTTRLFFSASAFNQNIGAWNVGSTTNMAGMFLGASAFNQNITAWNVGSVTNMNGIFRSASAFNQNIGAWNVNSVTNMDGMFLGAAAFNQNITAWNVVSVTNMNSMFRGATAFNQNLCAWNTKIPFINNIDIFRDSGCTFKTTPTTSSGPSFCAVDTCAT